MRRYQLCPLSKKFLDKTAQSNPPKKIEEECKPAQEKKITYATPYPAEILMAMDRLDNEESNRDFYGYPGL